MRADWLNFIDYKTLELLIIATLFVQLCYFIYFFVAKKYHEIGKMEFTNVALIIAINKEIANYNILDIVDFRFLSIGNSPDKKNDIFGLNVMHNGYYVIFQYHNRTNFHEILLKSMAEMEELVGFIHAQMPKGRVEIN